MAVSMFAVTWQFKNSCPYEMSFCVLTKQIIGIKIAHTVSAQWPVVERLALR